MHRYTKLLLASLTATAILAMAVSNASANSLSVSNNRLWNATWTSLRFIALSRTVLCPVTLEGSFHSATIVKTAQALIGYVTRAIVENTNCRGGNATVATETLPWHIRFRGYSGILPRITLIILGLIGTRFRVQPTGEVACNATSDATHPAVGNIRINETTGLAEQLIPDENAAIPLESGLCPFAGSGRFGEGSQTLTELPTGNRITIRLI